jgi:methenyltetrahydrofolate cyclohydrolase
MGFADRPFIELLDQIAAREPAPGGGSAAALAGATAAALAEMAAAFAPVSGGSQDDRAAALRARAASLRARQLELADEDLRSYGPVLEAAGLDRSDPSRESRLAAALSASAGAPLAVAAGTAEIAELAAELAESGSPHLVGDATAAVVLAEAATRAAVRLVELNLARVPHDARLGAAAQLAARARAARLRVLADG